MADQMQAIANRAAFHFAMIEEGGASFYEAPSLKCARLLACCLKQEFRLAVSPSGGQHLAHRFILRHALPRQQNTFTQFMSGVGHEKIGPASVSKLERRPDERATES
jgi:hypothetical protein